MRAVLTTIALAGLSGAALAQPVIDGRNITPANWGTAVVLQDTNTQFGNQVTTLDGNELDAMYMRSDADNLYIALSGNVHDNNAVVLFIDTIAQAPTPGGETIVTTEPGMLCPGGAVPTLVQIYSNTKFDEGFAPEYAVLFSVGAFPGLTLARTVFATDLVHIPTMTTEVLGVGATNTGNGLLTGDSGAEIAHDNSNIAGVGNYCYDPDDPDDPNDLFCDTRFPNAGSGQIPADVTTGIEIKLPKSLIGIAPNATIRLFAMLSNNAQGNSPPPEWPDQVPGACGRFGFAANQGLPGLAGFGNLATFTPGGPLRLDFTSAPGNQFVQVVVP